MKNLKQYFTCLSSPQKLFSSSNSSHKSPTMSTTTLKVSPAVVAPSTSTSSTVSASSSPMASSNVQSKLIVENMSSVISSVKKQQRRAKRKRRVAAAAGGDEPEIVDISDIMSNSLRFVSPNVSGAAATTIGSEDDGDDAESGHVVVAAGAAVASHIPNDDGAMAATAAKNSAADKKRATSLTRRRSKSTSRGSYKENTNSANRRTTAPKSPTVQNVSTVKSTTPLKTTPATTTPKKNAFDMLMNARNKSIGGPSSPVNDQPPATSSAATAESSLNTSSSISNVTKTKRKLELEAWADRKGAAKRKVLDDEAGEYVNKQMQKRAKRLKRLLGNSKSCSNDNDDDVDVVNGDSAVAVDVCAGDVSDVAVKDAKPDKTDDELSEALDPNESFVRFNFKRSGKIRESTRKSRKKKIQVFDDDIDDVVDAVSTVENPSTVESDVPSPPAIEDPQTIESTVEPEPKSPTIITVPNILSTLRSPPPTKSPHKPYHARRKSVAPKTPTKSPRASMTSLNSGRSNSKSPPFVPDDIDMRLSSPIKKRDSLLGYFNKVDKSPAVVLQPVEVVCPAANVEKTVEKLTKKRGRAPKAKSIDRRRDSNSPLATVLFDEGTPSRNSGKKLLGRTSTTRKIEKLSKASETLPLRDETTIEIDSSSTSSAPPVVIETDDDPLPATPNNTTIDEVPPQFRPRRGCRDKPTTYRIDMERSPAKTAAQKSIKRACRLLSGGCSPQKSASSSHAGSPARSTPSRKLAPIFVKAPVRVPVDPETLRARQEFLMSGIPEKMRLDIERQRAFVESYECELDVFPLVSHVQQLEEPVAGERIPPLIRYRVDAVTTTPATIGRIFKLGIAIEAEELSATASAASSDANSLKLTKPKDLVKQLKELDTQSKFIYFRCYKQLRRMYEDHINSSGDDHVNSESRSKIDVVDASESSNDSVCIIDAPSSAPTTFFASNGTIMFTEKYKALSSDEIVINSLPALQLKRFLDSWKENYVQRSTSNGHRRVASNETTDDDEFDCASNSASASASLGKAVCLVGPCGVGKTNAVYALANELNFKVLEINAGCKRTGKKILQELHEATQSHQVKSGVGANATADRLFRCSQQQNGEESSSNSAGTPTTAAAAKLSLILIEDADIVFEQDNGFVDAIFQLVATSKRPVILVANRRSAPHLVRFVGGGNAIDFEPALASHAGKWLSLVSVVEQRYVGDVECQRLYRFNGCNMRRTLLDLQFFVQSGGDRVRQPEGDCGRHYAHQRLYGTFADAHMATNGWLPYPVRFEAIAAKTDVIFDRGSESGKNKADTGSLADVLAFYETMSAAQRLQSMAHKQVKRCGYDRSDDGADDGLTWNMAEEVAFAMAESALAVRRRRRAFRVEPMSAGEADASIIMGSRSTQSYAAPRLADGFTASVGGMAHSCAEKRAISLDVEPVLRSICRCERLRTQTERTNRRFYHYLRSSMVVGNSFSTAETFDRHCDVLCDAETVVEADPVVGT